jgi:hypothetical protein
VPKNSITIKDENTGDELIVVTPQVVVEIARAIQDRDAAAEKRQQAYLVRHINGRLFLCLQEGAGSAYYSIAKDANKGVREEDTVAATEAFRYTGRAIRQRRKQ